MAISPDHQPQRGSHQRSSPQHGAPLHEVKANLFKALADPVRVGVLHALEDPTGPELTLDQLAARTGHEVDVVARHLAVLRRHGAVVARRDDDLVLFRIAHPRIVELLGIARAFLHETGPGRPRLTPVADHRPQD